MKNAIDILIDKIKKTNNPTVLGLDPRYDMIPKIRKVAKHSYFLIPGYGAQGGKAKDIALGFDKNGLGGIVNASRSLMFAYKSDLWKEKFKEEEFEKATRQEAIRMKNELNNNKSNILRLY